MLTIPEKLKITNKQRSIIKATSEGLEESLRDARAIYHRKKKDIEIKLYKSRFLKTGISSFIFFITSLITCIYMFYTKVEFIPEEKLIIYVIYCYVVTCIFTLLPYTPLAIYMFMDSRLGRRIVTKQHLKKFYINEGRTIEFAHHCTQMMLISQNNVQREFFTEKCSIYSRQGLLMILRLTNGLMALNNFSILKERDRIKFSKNVQQFLKEFNGSLLISYKGRVPKYVLDAYEQINMNIIELRRKEILI